MQTVAPKYERPTSLLNALSLLNQGFLPIAGGTDYYPSKVGKPLVDNLLDLSAVADFDRVVSEGEAGLSLSALTTWRRCQTDFESGALPLWCAALAQSAKDVGGWQVQNRGTLGGNLCNASPAADGVVALLALGADVVLVGVQPDDAGAGLMILKERSVALSNFVLGNRITVKQPDELLTRICLPGHSENARSVFLKLGHRKYLVISIVMVAVLLDFNADNRITICRIAIGSCAKAALRVSTLEKKILGTHRSKVMDIVTAGIAEVVSAIRPIDDVRGTTEYRQFAAQELVLRAFTEVLR
jgi:CO/xanthine dehydrogenase FAD-binding subunit